MSSAHHGGRSSAAANAASTSGGVAGSTPSSSHQAAGSRRNRKSQKGNMSGAKGGRQQQQQGRPPLPFHQQPGGFQGGGGPRGPGFPGQMPPPGMHPHMMPSTGMGFGVAEEEEPIDYIIDDTSRLTSRDIAMARYKRNHELLNMIFDARRIDGLVPPPSPYATMDKAALEEKLATIEQETNALKRAHDEKGILWRQEADRHEDMLHAAPKRLKQQCAEEEAERRAAMRGDDGDNDTPLWARAPFKGRILGVGYVRALTPDEVRAQLPPTPPSHSPSPPPRPQQPAATATPQQPTQQQSQQSSVPAAHPQSQSQSSSGIAPQGPQNAGSTASASDQQVSHGADEGKLMSDAKIGNAGAIADNAVPGLDSAEVGYDEEDVDGDGDGDGDDDDGDDNEEEEEEDGEGEDEDDGDDDEDEDGGAGVGDDGEEDEHAVTAAHDDGGIHNELGNVGEEDHMIAMGMADTDPTQEDDDMQSFLANASDAASTGPVAPDTGDREDSATFQAAKGEDLLPHLEEADTRITAAEDISMQEADSADVLKDSEDKETHEAAAHHETNDTLVAMPPQSDEDAAKQVPPASAEAIDDAAQA